MPASFKDVFASAGVDQDAKPWPKMIVPLFGSNIVRLVDGTGLWPVGPPMLKIDELQWQQAAILLALNMPANVISMLTGSLRPGALLRSRYFRISSNTPVGPTPVQVKAVPQGRAVAPGGSTAGATLDVVVLRPRTVKLSIRAVQVRAPQGGIVNHSKKPYDPRTLVDQMNSIWAPQANVVFELISSSPVQIVDEVEIAKALDLNTSSGAQVPAMVVIQRFTDILSRLKDQSAHLTMFLVESAGDLKDSRALYVRAKQVIGVTDPKLGISLIGDERTTHPGTHGA